MQTARETPVDNKPAPKEPARRGTPLPVQWADKIGLRLVLVNPANPFARRTLATFL
jgi:hypothetical protein